MTLYEPSAKEEEHSVYRIKYHYVDVVNNARLGGHYLFYIGPQDTIMWYIMINKGSISIFRLFFLFM